ncbi:MAG: Clp protease ClpP [Rhizobiaceae bacterium]|nr:Clp protease ClpP [Rhizobiaceae bacterium]MCV0406332.1 Clp protease ClpP [Rhizobiaceae bacterium]
MSLRNLPEIKAFDRNSVLSFEPDDVALSRWKPGVHAATEGDDNVISIYDIISEWDGVSTSRIAAALRRIGKNEVTVNINSPGGDFFEGIGIYNLLREHPAKVTVKIMGMAASAASVVAMAGDDIQISEVGFIMVHNAWAIAIGNRHDFRSAADTLEPFDAAMAGLYATRAGVDRSEAVKWMDAETWFNGAQAIEAGLADRILSSSEVDNTGAQGTQTLAALRRVDTALAKQGVPRSERRTLLSEIKNGKPGAAVTAMQDAGDELSASLADLLKTVNS